MEPSNKSKDISDGQRTETSEDRKAWLIKNIAELSQNTRSIYLLYLGFLAYCAVTVVGTSDRQIILDEAVSLPIIGVDVPMTGFFILAPILAISVFIYLQLYLQELKVLRDKLYKEYPDVERERLYPWMLNIADRQGPGLVRRLQKWAVSLVLWWMLPVVLFLFALWFIVKHDPIWSYVVGLMPAVGVCAVVYFWYQYEGRGSLASGMWLSSLRHPTSIGAAFILVGAVFLEGLILFNGIPLSISGDGFTADLSYQTLITENKEEYGTYWVDLKGVHLEGANLKATVLRNADLEDAQLQDADLTQAQLQDAFLYNANLQDAYLHQAQLKGADLAAANLQGANLSDTNLQGVHLVDTNLRGAYLSDTKGLTAYQLCQAKTLYEVKSLDSFLKEEVIEQCPERFDEPVPIDSLIITIPKMGAN